MSINLEDLHRLMIDVELALIDLRNKKRALEQAVAQVCGTPPPEPSPCYSGPAPPPLPTHD